MIDSGSKGFLPGTTPIANPYDGGGAQNAARSLGSIGRALMQAGNEGAQIAQQLQGIENSRTENEVLNQWEKAFGEHEAATMGIANPQERVAKMENLLSGLKEKGFKDRAVSPIVRDRLDAHWGRLETKYRNRALSQAAQLMVEQERTVHETGIQRDIDNNDLEGARERIRRRVESGQMSAADGEAEEYQIEKRINKKLLEEKIYHDPNDASQYLDMVPEAERWRYEEKIEISKKRKEAQAMGKIMSLYAMDGFPTLKTFEQSLDADEYITEEAKAKALDTWENNTPLSYEEEKLHLDRLNDAHLALKNGQMSRDNYSKLHHEIARDILALANRPGSGVLRSRAYQLDPENWKGDNLQTDDLDTNLQALEMIDKAFVGAKGFVSQFNSDPDTAPTPREAVDAKGAQQLAYNLTKDWLSYPETKELLRKAEKGAYTVIRDYYMQQAAEATGAIDVSGFSTDGDLGAEVDEILKSGDFERNRDEQPSQAGESLLPEYALPQGR